MIVNIDPADIMAFVNILFFIGNIAFTVKVVQIAKLKINTLIASNTKFTTSVETLVESVDTANQQGLIDSAVAKATGEIPIE